MAYNSSSRNGQSQEDVHSDLNKHLRVANVLNGNNHPILVGDEICPLEISKDSVQYRQTPSDPDDIVTKKYVHNSLSFREILRSGWSSGAYDIFIPLNSVAERTSTSGANEYHSLIMPYDATLERVIVRCANAADSTAIQVYIASNGTAVPVAMTAAQYTVRVDMSSAATSYIFDFGNATISAGQIMCLNFEPTSSCGDSNATTIIRYTPTLNAY